MDAHEECRKRELEGYLRGLTEGKRLGRAEAYEEILNAAAEEIGEGPCTNTLMN